MKPLNFVFMGTPVFAVPALKALIEAGHKPLCVYTQPPRPAGRGQDLQSSPIYKTAVEQNLRCRTPSTLKDVQETNFIRSLSPDVAVVAAYGLMLPKAVVEMPQFGCINIHASLLPRWRGAAPIQRAIMAGDETTGITIMRMDEGLDTGPILAQQEISINSDNAGELHDRLSTLGAETLTTTLEKLTLGEIKERHQSESDSSYATRLTSDDEHLDWDRTAQQLGWQVRALSPRPNAHFIFKDERWKVLSASTSSTPTTAKPGQVIDNQLTISCAVGVLKPDRVQRPGRKAMTAAEALRGTPIPAGTLLR